MNYKKKYLKYKLKYLTAKKLYGGSIPTNMLQELNSRYTKLKQAFKELIQKLDKEYEDFNKIKPFIRNNDFINKHQEIYTNMKNHAENYDNLVEELYKNEQYFIQKTEEEIQNSSRKQYLKDMEQFLLNKETQTPHIKHALFLETTIIQQLLYHIVEEKNKIRYKQEELNRKIEKEKERYFTLQLEYNDNMKKIKSFFPNKQYKSSLDEPPRSLDDKWFD